MPFKRGGKTRDVSEMLPVRSYPGLLGICKLCFSLELKHIQACEAKVSIAREVQTGILKHFQKDEILSGIHEAKGRYPVS